MGYRVGNLVLRRRASGSVKRDSNVYPCLSNVYPTIDLPKWNIKYGYPLSNALLQYRRKSERCKPHNAARHACMHA